LVVIYNVVVTASFPFIQPCSPISAEHVPAGDGWSAILDAELCFPGPNGAPNFYWRNAAIGSDRQHQLAVFAFDLLHHNGHDLRSIPLTGRRRRLERLLRRAKVPCLHLVEAFDDGQKLLEAAERHGLEGVVSKQRSAPYKSGECWDWRKVKTSLARSKQRAVEAVREDTVTGDERESLPLLGSICGRLEGRSIDALLTAGSPVTRLTCEPISVRARGMF
jgi:ATP-dependent DNA ligase